MEPQPSGRDQAAGVRRRRMLGLALGAGLVPALGAAAQAASHTSPETAPPLSAEALGGRVAAVAAGQLGVPYAWGGGDRLGASLGFCDEQ
ncbi:hypothetical protein ACFU7Y_43010, partial [Kitasatospora sp. NPDC057542]